MSESLRLFCRMIRFLSAAAILFGSTMALQAADPSQPVPLKRVVIYSSGVAFFEHEGEVEGTRQIDFQFRVGDIKDLLKSMVLQDLSGGSVSTVKYSPPEPISRTLKTFAVDLTRSSTLAELLQQARGQKVRIDIPNPLEGLIVGVELRERKDGNDELLVIKTATGIRRVPLDTIVEMKLLDDRVDRELNQGLELLASAHSSDHKAVTLEFRGEGKRIVRISYIQEFPIWKTSYRLVLKDGEPPFLQGWAILENTSEQDWNNVRLGLVSGRPISFVMDLYQSLYVPRPEVIPEHFASLESRTYGQDLMSADEEKALAAALRRRPDRRDAGGAGDMTGYRPEGRQRTIGMGGGGFGGYGMSGMSGAMGGGMPGDMGGAMPGGMPAHRLDLTKGVVSAAHAVDVGEMFRYTIAAPVDLPRQRSAMLPIVSESIGGQKVFVYNPSVQVKHPLCALRLKNTTKLHLMQGPITVFDGGEYAGDARIEDIPPGSTRLISFALDLDTEVVREQRTPPEVLISATIVQGSLIATHKLARGTRYIVKNSGDAEKEVMIEQPIEADWTLVTPAEPAEKTRDLYRFRVTAKPAKPESLVVLEEKLQQQPFVIAQSDDKALLAIAHAKGVAPSVQNALREVAARRAKLAKATQQRAELELLITGSINEQSRVRENLRQLDRTVDLYRRFYQKLGELEDQIQDLRDKHRTAQKDEVAQKTALEDFVTNLNVPSN